jgi:hypothetical protein
MDIPVACGASLRIHSLLSSELFAMDVILNFPVAAIEYSLLYMLGGGGLIGALVIFAIARLLRR